MSDYIILCGNPGTGKSTILNCLTQTTSFKSGISPGHGLTTELQLVKVGTTTYGDTPGLDDDTHREKAAAAIKQALSQDGVYKICFVVTLIGGRVQPSDAATMKLVLAAIPTHVPYGIIVNKVGPTVYEKVKTNADGWRDAIVLQLMAGHRVTSHIFFLPEVDEWREKGDFVGELPARFHQFLDTLPAMIIVPTDVGEVKASLVKAETEALGKKLEQAVADGKDAEARVKKMEELSEQQAKELEDSKAAIEKAQKELQELREKQPSKGGFHIQINLDKDAIANALALMF